MSKPALAGFFNLLPVESPDVVIGEDGKPTNESMQEVLTAIANKSGHGGRISGASVENDNFNGMNEYAQSRMSDNTNQSRKSYDLFSNNCATFMQKVLQAGGVDTPSMIDPRPNSYIDELRDNDGFEKVDR